MDSGKQKPKWMVPVPGEDQEYKDNKDLIHLFLYESHKRYGYGIAVDEATSELAESLLRAIRVYDPNNATGIPRRRFYRLILSRSLRCRGFYSKGVVNRTGGVVPDRISGDEFPGIQRDVLVLAGSMLEPREWLVIQLIYFERLTLRQVGSRMGYSMEWVRQIKNRALAKMLEWFTSQGLMNMHEAREFENG